MIGFLVAMRLFRFGEFERRVRSLDAHTPWEVTARSMLVEYHVLWVCDGLKYCVCGHSEFWGCHFYATVADYKIVGLQTVRSSEGIVLSLSKVVSSIDNAQTLLLSFTDRPMFRRICG